MKPSAWGTKRPASQTSFPAVSSSVWRLRVRWNRPSLLLADEPTGNLDSCTSMEIMAVFQQLNDQGITIVVVTHEPDIAQFSRRMVVMKDGLMILDQPVRRRAVASVELAAAQPEEVLQ